MKQIVFATLIIVAFLTILGVVGSAERASQIVYTMPVELRNHIVAKGCTTDKEIMNEYLEHQSEYDKLCEENYW